MTAPIIIIGSGFAAYQLVKTVRRMDPTIPIQIFTADDGAEYNKPDLSHVFSKQQTATDLVIKSGEAFADEHKVTLHANTLIERVEAQTNQVVANGHYYPYSKLVFATGAKAFVPPMHGNAVAEVLTLNSRIEYQSAENQLSLAKRVLVIGGGLIGVEIAMDLANSGKSVTVVEPNTHLLANLIPEFVAVPLENQLQQQGVHLALSNSVQAVNRINQTLVVTLNDGREYHVDAVISAAGLRANTKLAASAGIDVGKGIAVDQCLQTSVKDVYALGDCAEIQGRMMPYLQPIVLSANVLAKQLLGQDAQLVLPPMMVKVKTSTYPIQLSGGFEPTSSWQVHITPSGMVAKAENLCKQFTGFVVTGDQVSQAFPLLRELSQSATN